ncbi:MAG: acyltransferase family protein [Desulfotomaculaceae bacterium]
MPGTPIQNRDNRDYSLDILRGIAVVLMIFHHVVTWLYTGSVRDIITIIGRISVGDMAAPIFFTVCGMSLYYSINSMQTKHLGTVNKLKSWRKET